MEGFISFSYATTQTIFTLKELRNVELSVEGETERLTPLKWCEQYSNWLPYLIIDYKMFLTETFDYSNTQLKYSDLLEPGASTALIIYSFKAFDGLWQTPKVGESYNYCDKSRIPLNK